jgi:hypothetical protein
MLSQYECTNCDSTEFPDVSILIKHVYYIWQGLINLITCSSESSGMYCHVLNWMSIKNMAVHPRRFWASYSTPLELEISLNNMCLCQASSLITVAPVFWVVVLCGSGLHCWHFRQAYCLCMHAYVHTYICACMHACMHTYIRTYIQTDRWTDRQTDIQQTDRQTSVLVVWTEFSFIYSVTDFEFSIARLAFCRWNLSEYGHNPCWLWLSV